MHSTRVIAITGASSGLGRATAIRLARDGASVAVCARRGDRLAAVAADIAAAGGIALPIVADVTREAEMQAFVAATVERFGRLDVMLCNAGFGITGVIDEISADEMQRLMEVNFLGTFHAARAALAVFRRQARGHLIVMSSLAGKRGVPYMGAYSATKFAQAGMAECVRAELLGTAIDVTVVYPVSTPTEFNDVMARESRAMTPSKGPRQRAEDVADAIARAIAHPVPELYPHSTSRALVWLNAFAPGLCDRVVQKFGRQRAR